MTSDVIEGLLVWNQMMAGLLIVIDQADHWLATRIRAWRRMEAIFLATLKELLIINRFAWFAEWGHVAMTGSGGGQCHNELNLMEVIIIISLYSLLSSKFSTIHNESANLLIKWN